MRRLVLAIFGSAALLVGTAAATLALPPIPVREAARSECESANPYNPEGPFTHGIYVSGVAAPTDPYQCGITIPDD
jgi:hypothetical protein